MTETQGDLFSDGALVGGELRPIVEVDKYDDDSGNLLSLSERFRIFHGLNPQVLEKIIDMALNLQRQGFRKCSAKMIVERLRWEVYFKTKGAEEYKLTNSYTSFYARLAIAVSPQLKDFFELRTQKSEWRPDADTVEIAREFCWRQAGFTNG